MVVVVVDVSWHPGGGTINVVHDHGPNVHIRDLQKVAVYLSLLLLHLLLPTTPRVVVLIVVVVAVTEDGGSGGGGRSGGWRGREGRMYARISIIIMGGGPSVIITCGVWPTRRGGRPCPIARCCCGDLGKGELVGFVGSISGSEGSLVGDVDWGLAGLDYCEWMLLVGRSTASPPMPRSYLSTQMPP